MWRRSTTRRQTPIKRATRCGALSPPAGLGILGGARQTRGFYAVRASDRSLITGYADLPDPKPGSPDPNPNFFDAIYSNSPVRVGTIRRYIDFGEKSGWVSVTVAETRAARTQLA